MLWEVRDEGIAWNERGYALDQGWDVKKPKLCVVCREHPPEVPDRESGSPVKRVCRRCHAERLLGDLRRLTKPEVSG